MPNLHQAKGFRFFFYTNEHEPKHIHVFKAGAKAKIDLVTLNVVVSSGMKLGDLKQALEIVQNHQQQFIKDWDEYFTE